MNFFLGRGAKFFDFALKLCELMWLNLLTLVCSIPVFTVGAAASAMHRVLVSIYRDSESGGVTRAYFKAFGQNFKQGTLIWLIYLLYYGVLALDHFAMKSLNNSTIGYVKLLVPVLAFIGTLSLVWVFVLQSRYTLTLKDTLLYALTRVIAFPIRTLLMALTLIIPFAVIIYFPRLTMLVLLLGISGMGLLRTCFYNHALEVMEDDSEQKSEEESQSE